jgi:hypothetical protein
MEIAEMYLIICHPDNKNYKRMRLNRLEDEVVAMLDCRKRALDEKWPAGITPRPVILPVPEPSHGMVKDADYGFLDE